MAIGEFGGAPAAVVGHGPMLAGPYYWLYEMSQASLNPSRAWADATRLFFKNPANPMAHTHFGKTVAAACEMFERSTRRYGKPEWRIDSTLVGGERIPVLAVIPETALRNDVAHLLAEHGLEATVVVDGDQARLMSCAAKPRVIIGCADPAVPIDPRFP